MYNKSEIKEVGIPIILEIPLQFRETTHEISRNSATKTNLFTKIMFYLPFDRLVFDRRGTVAGFGLATA